MQVLNSVDGKNDAHEYFQKMILVYGAVNDLSDFPLVSGKSCGTDECILNHSSARNPSQNL